MLEIKKDKKRRELVKIFERERLKLKIISKNTNLSWKIRIEADKRLALNCPRNSSRVRVRNRSLMKTRVGRAVIKDFGLDRISLKEEIILGNIPGHSPYTY